MANLRNKLLLDVEIVNCIQNCMHCYTPSKGRYNLSLKELQWIYKEFQSAFSGKVLLNTHYLILEPTLHPQIIEILKWIRAEFDKKYNSGIVTNGYGIARNPELFDKLLKAGIMHYQFTLYGIDDIHDKFARRKGAYKDIITAIELAKKNKTAISWNIHMHKKMIKQIPVISSLAEKYKIDDYGWQVNEPIGNAMNIINERPAKSELKPYRKYLKNLYKTHKTEGEITKEALKGKILRDNSYVAKDLPQSLFSITHDYSIYVFFRGFSDYSYCGNLKKDGAQKILQNYMSNTIPCLKIKRKISQKQLAKLYGNTKSDVIYTPVSLINYWYLKYWKDDN